MANRIFPGGNGSAGKGLIDIAPVGDGCTLLTPSVTQPPPEDELHIALTQVMQKWMLEHNVRVRVTLPVVHKGTTVAIFIWWDQPET